MDGMIRNVKFWGKNVLESIGISLAAAVVLLLFMGIMGSDISDEAGFWEFMMGVFPYYLLLSGVFVVAMLAVSYFQLYFSVLVSMNVTRRACVTGIMASLTVTILGILTVIWGIWKFCPGDVAKDGMKLFSLSAAIFFYAAGICVFLGTVILRWGKIGTIVMVVLCGAVGAFVGGWVSATSNGIEELVKLLMQFQFSGVLIGSLVIYILAGIFAAIFTRKVEVRV